MSKNSDLPSKSTPSLPSSENREQGVTAQPAADSRPISRRQALATGAAGAVLGTLSVSPAKVSAGLRSDARVRSNRRQTGDSLLKQQARDDYHNSLSEFGGWMSNPIGQLLKPAARDVPYDIDVAIIGSGYGGSICAARLGQQRNPDTRICLFERGREWVPGDYPDTFRNVLASNRLSLRRSNRNEVTRPTSLFNYYKSDDVDVITGTGLGGTSLINASVAIQPDREVFLKSRWPENLRYREVLDPFYHSAAVEMGVAPGVLDSTPKMVAQRRAAARLAASDKNFYAANLTVTFDDRYLDRYGQNRQGMLQRPCTACGDCMSGCNIGAKNTVQMNYMPLAKRNGVEIYTQTEVRWIEKVDGYYRLHMVFHRGVGDDVRSVPFTKTARVVVVAGGSLGSSAIMLRSRERGLDLSSTLGQHWSGNGDVLGFMTNTENFANSGGYGAYAGGQPPVGPTIQTVTEVNPNGPVDKRILIEDGSMPRAYANVIGTLMRDIDMDRLMVLFGMGHDGSRGRVVLKSDVPVIEWPGAKESRYRKSMRSMLERIATAHGGRYRYLRLFGSSLITVHPLGGCNMHDDPGWGVVNDIGQVFDGAEGGRVGADGSAMVHQGLYIADGSIIPGSLGANPFFTISAISERIAASIAMDPQFQDLFGQA